jgi:hypothetical protein
MLKNKSKVRISVPELSGFAGAIIPGAPELLRQF